MKYYRKPRILVTMVLALVAAVGIAKVSHADPGAAPAFSAIAEYDPGTGVIVVSVANVKSWVISSASLGMTGPDDVNDVLPQSGISGAFVTDNIRRVGELAFDAPSPAGFSYTDVDLGAVAATNLPAGGDGLLADFDLDGDVDGTDFLKWQRELFDAGDLANWEDEYGLTGEGGGGAPDLIISWTRADDNSEGSQAVVYLGSSASVNLSAVPEPGTLSLLALASLISLGRRRR